MKDFNINNYVGVKLTDEGLKILESIHNELLRTVTPEVANLIGNFKIPQVDDEGYYQIQCSQLMYFLGKYMYTGNPNPPFEMNIKISDKYLVEHAVNKSKKR